MKTPNYCYELLLRALQVELSNMYRTMEGTHYKSPELAIDAVLNG